MAVLQMKICGQPLFFALHEIKKQKVRKNKNPVKMGKYKITGKRSRGNQILLLAGVFIVMIKRGDRTLIPNGNTMIRQGDQLVFRRQKHAKQVYV